MMPILVTGRGTSGSWAIRGEQLGSAAGFQVRRQAESAAGFSAVVMVKRPLDHIVRDCHLRRVPLIWDAVDSWPQPDGNEWGQLACEAWLVQQVATLRPALVIGATERMAMDVERLTNVPSVCVPHHARPDQKVNPIREMVFSVGYEGGPQYIAKWSESIEKECKRRGWVFVMNPESIASVDIVLALRDQDGYAPRHWKSNVKLANAQATGTPFVGSPECGYLETRVGNAERFARTERDLSNAFDALSSYGERLRVQGWMMAAAPKLEKVATQYREIVLRALDGHG